MKRKKDMEKRKVYLNRSEYGRPGIKSCIESCAILGCGKSEKEGKHSKGKTGYKKNQDVK